MKNIICLWHCLKKSHHQIRQAKLSVSQSCLKVGIQANLLYKLCGPNYQSLNKPVGVAQLPSGKVIVADTFNDRIVMFSKTGKFEKEFATSA